MTTPDPPAVPPIHPAGLPRGLDALSVGRSLFGETGAPPPPAVEGFSEISWLAAGGFGTIWRAKRNRDGSRVALKIPHRCDPETADRIEQEAESLKALDHPGIVRLLDVTAASDGAPVLVMELVDGPPLTARLPQHGFDFDHALQIFLPILDAVAHAHSRGIVHRDLKPSNILLGADGTPKVSDFGLAQPLEDQRVAFSLTKSGLLAGTVEYLAPERYDPGVKAGPAADIYALGVMLCELLTGRPPRGAWAPPSEIKKLDVRLDDLILCAIHADPAQRLPSATVFRKSLEEIRDTRPRYAGTPLVTRPVRYADFIWTLAGLYFLASGFCSLLSMNNTKVPGIFDLTFGHTKLLGGYWALWILCLGMGLVWTWQMTRLWRFRNIPLRESLPSPFGLHLGHSRGSAVLVGFAQVLCAWAPLVYMTWIYSQCWNWATPETPMWEKALSITRWGSEEPLSPWTWDPSGMFSADEFWIREVQPGLAPGTWQLHDRQSFFVVTQPLLMTLGAAAVALGLIATLAAAAAEWRGRRRVLLALLSIGMVSSGFSLRATIEAETRDLSEKRQRSPARSEVISRYFHYHQLSQTLPGIVRALHGNSGELPPEVSDVFAPQIQSGGDSLQTRAEFLRRRAEARLAHAAQNRSLEALHLAVPEAGGTSPIRVEIAFESFTDPAGNSSAGTFTEIRCKGLLRDASSAGVINTWVETSTPLYAAEPRGLATPEAAAWLDSFLRCLSAGGCPDLESFLLPTMLLIEPSDARHYTPAPRETLAAALRTSRTSRASWTSLVFTSTAPPVLHSMSGARWKLTCDLAQSGSRRNGHQSPRRPLHWQIEIVFVDGRWQILRLRM